MSITEEIHKMAINAEIEEIHKMAINAEIEEIHKMAVNAEIKEQPERIKQLLLDCPDNYIRLVEDATDTELKIAIQVGKQYLIGNKIRLIAMQTELVKRQENTEKNMKERWMKGIR